MAHGIHGKGDERWEEKENDYENEERERARAEEWPTEYTERGTGGGRRKRTITRTRNDFLGAGGRAAGAEMAGREPLSRGAGDGGK